MLRLSWWSRFRCELRCTCVGSSHRVMHTTEVLTGNRAWLSLANTLMRFSIHFLGCLSSCKLCTRCSALCAAPLCLRMCYYMCALGLVFLHVLFTRSKCSVF